MLNKALALSERCVLSMLSLFLEPWPLKFPSLAKCGKLASISCPSIDTPRSRDQLFKSGFSIVFVVLPWCLIWSAYVFEWLVWTREALLWNLNCLALVWVGESAWGLFGFSDGAEGALVETSNGSSIGKVNEKLEAEKCLRDDENPRIKKNRKSIHCNIYFLLKKSLTFFWSIRQCVKW